MTAIRSSGDSKAAMIGEFGGRTAGVEWEVGEFLHLLGLSASAENKQAASKADTEKDQDNERDEKFHHGRGHGGFTARVVSDDESGDDGHY